MEKNTETSFIQIEVDTDFIDMIPSYLERRSNEFASIEGLIQDGQFQTIQSIGHKIKGNAALFGLSWLGEKAAELEEAAQTQNSHRIIELKEEMSHYLQKVKFSTANESTLR